MNDILTMLKNKIGTPCVYEYTTYGSNQTTTQTKDLISDDKLFSFIDLATAEVKQMLSIDDIIFNYSELIVEGAYLHFLTHQIFNAPSGYNASYLGTISLTSLNSPASSAYDNKYLYLYQTLLPVHMDKIRILKEDLNKSKNKVKRCFDCGGENCRLH